MLTCLQGPQGKADTGDIAIAAEDGRPGEHSDSDEAAVGVGGGRARGGGAGGGSRELGKRSELIGARIAKDFGKLGYFKGQVTGYDDKKKVFRVVYEVRCGAPLRQARVAPCGQKAKACRNMSLCGQTVKESDVWLSK